MTYGGDLTTERKWGKDGYRDGYDDEKRGKQGKGGKDKRRYKWDDGKHTESKSESVMRA